MRLAAPLVISIALWSPVNLASAQSVAVDDAFECTDEDVHGSGLFGWTANLPADSWESDENDGVSPKTDELGGSSFGGDVDFYENFLLTGHPLWVDASIEASMTSGDDDGMGLVGRYAATDSYYSCYATNNRLPDCDGGGGSVATSRFALIKVTDDACANDYAVAETDQFTYLPNETYRMRLTVIGDQVECIVDADLDGVLGSAGDHILSFTDPSPLPGGMFGLASYDNGNADVGGQDLVFDDVLVLSHDADDDGDGIPNVVEAALGTDSMSADSDGDGLSDGFEVGLQATPNDTDQDGSIDALDSDSDGDGIGDDGEAARDADCDGLPDSRDTDADGDGTSDADDLDLDNDGIPNNRENLLGLNPLGDNDGDGVANFLDADDRGDGQPQACVDDDGDGICDAAGPTFDTDGDGVPNHLDLDSDNDGIVDSVEAGHGLDADGDGTIDCAGGFGTNGLCDDVESSPDSGDLNYTLLNTDGLLEHGDAVPDFLDLDSDADGDHDVAEVDELSPLDADGDGRIDDLTDEDNDGIADAADDDPGRHGEPGANPLDDDDDGDGVPDPYDPDGAGPTAGDSDGDGVDDAQECATGWPCPDSDHDGVPDYADDDDLDDDGILDEDDLDDDNDGIADTIESGYGVDPSGDNDGDGIPNYLDATDRGDGAPANCEDLDSDGACDSLDPAFDTDGDNIPDHRDLDSDNDSIYDSDESGTDAQDVNGDGRIDCPSGVGANGLCDELETNPDSGQTSEPVDTDADGAPDFQDTDADGDTILDAHEAGDGDPQTDPVDTDGDGDPDFQDLDSDGDTIPDEQEAGDADPDTPPVDTDGDGDPDFQDTDADGDGVDDEDEAGDDPKNPIDTDGDGDPDFQDPDSDGDGTADGSDPCRLIGDDQTDTDGDGLGDACDLDADGDGYDDDLGISGGGCSVVSGSPTSSLTLLVLVAGWLLRRRFALCLGVVGCAMVLLPPQLRAQQMVETEYTVERFRLSGDRAGILDVESASIGTHLVLDLGLWFGYSDDPLNVYREGESGERERVGSLLSHRLGGTLLGSLTLWNRFQLGISLPVVLSQDQDVAMLAGPPGSVSSFGVGDVRLSPKAQLLDHARHWVDLGVRVGFTLPTGSSSDYFGDGAAMIEPELLISRPLGDRFRAGLNVGYRFREAQRALDLIVNDEVYAHAGLAFMATDAVELDATVGVATAAGDLLGAFNRNHSELRGGAAYHLDRFIVFAAAGVGTSEGFGTPDWRALAGLRFGGRASEEASVFEAMPTVVADRPSSSDRQPADRDRDGILDVDDACPDAAEDLDNFADSDGCPDPDNDGDGVADLEDACPVEAGVSQHEGCQAPDRDGDGVADAVDNCPDVAGKATYQGCGSPQAVSIAKGKLELIDRVFFRTNSSTIRHVSHPLLRNVAVVLNNHPDIARVVVEGHTDSRGSAAANKRLSQRRAEAVVAFLISEGVDGKRLLARGYGEDRPVESNADAEGRAANRRVEFRLVGGDAMIGDSENRPAEAVD